SELRLIDAVKAENVVRVKELIDLGSDIDEQDEHGWTPLNWAAGRGDTELVRLLVERGADVFKVGRDLRTPYDIALAAGHVDVVKMLRQAEDAVEGEKPSRPERKYSKAYHLRSLRDFSGWKEISGQADQHSLSDDDVVFIHQDHTVTKSMWHDENVIFNQVTPEWREFCANKLEFKAPTDLDLLAM